VSGLPGRWARVVDPGPLTTVQDPGRPGWAALGVPRGGWLDPASATLGNRLVGNPEDAAVLECLAGDCVLEVGAAVTLAVTGGRCTVDVGGWPAAHGEAVTLPAGARLALGPVTAGLRVYVALAGGLAVDPVLGSCATDTLSWTGPPRVTAGTVLPVGAPGRPPALTGPVVPRATLPGPGPAVLRVSPGPRAGWFRPGVLGALAAQDWVVQPDSDRVALRLAGPIPLARRPDAPRELPSEGLVLGAVQVPTSGQPLVFLNDHPTTGGYPVAAVVDRRDLRVCAHLRPGDGVRFRPG
jgi:biotin-dependent carboxylase-like uncharacterized protein